jgi:DNA-binding HxlR family transcriptional regulator
MLTATLRSLERDGLISRRVVASKPPRVEYMLTEMGASLAEPIHALTRWAFAHATLIRDSHEQFDQGGQTQERTAPRAA